VFARVVYERLLKHINNNNILVGEQHGFRPKSSTGKDSLNLIYQVFHPFNKKF
jgi:hypothetical protein